MKKMLKIYQHHNDAVKHLNYSFKLSIFAGQVLRLMCKLVEPKINKANMANWS